MTRYSGSCDRRNNVAGGHTGDLLEDIVAAVSHVECSRVDVPNPSREVESGGDGAHSIIPRRRHISYFAVMTVTDEQPVS